MVVRHCGFPPQLGRRAGGAAAAGIGRGIGRSDCRRPAMEKIGLVPAPAAPHKCAS
jgi:hypothetical protein